MAYFKLGAKPEGQFMATSGTLVDSELPCFRPIVDILQVRYSLTIFMKKFAENYSVSVRIRPLSVVLINPKS